MQFSWMLLKSYGKGNFSREAQLMRKAFEERAARTQTLLREVMLVADKQVWRCDPQTHIEGVTYEAVTRLLQGYVENEVDMNTDQTCRENCGAYTFAENHGCFKDMYCAKQQRCSGKILNCQYVDSDMWICPAVRFWNTSKKQDEIIFIGRFSQPQAIVVTSISSMRTDEFWGKKELAHVERPKWIRGGVGSSGIAAIVCVRATNRAPSPIGSSVCEKQHRILRPTSE